jgi:hypothetical protein
MRGGRASTAWVASCLMGWDVMAREGRETGRGKREGSRSLLFRESCEVTVSVHVTFSLVSGSHVRKRQRANKKRDDRSEVSSLFDVSANDDDLSPNLFPLPKTSSFPASYTSRCTLIKTKTVFQML